MNTRFLRARPLRWLLLPLLALAAWLGYWWWLAPYPTDNRAAHLLHRAATLPLHWLQGRLATAPEQLTFQLDSGAYRTLAASRAVGLQRGLLPHGAKTWVPATVQRNDAPAQTAKVRLKGDYPDHWRGEKWSLRVQLPARAAPLDSMRTFSVQAPETRNWLAEWLLFRLLREEGLIALHYEFAAVSLNGQAKGVYAVEESFGPELLAHNHRPPGVLLKFNEDELIDPALRPAERRNATQAEIFDAAAIEAFDQKQIDASVGLTSQFQRGQRLLSRLRSGAYMPHAACDVTALGKLFAIADLLGAHHATRWKNLRFYYNATTNRLEPVAYDGNSGGFSGRPYLERFRLQQYHPNELPAWKNRLLYDVTVQDAYSAEVARLSAPGFLEAFLARAEPQLSAYRHLLYRDYPTYDYLFAETNFFRNRDVLAAFSKREALRPRP